MYTESQLSAIDSITAAEKPTAVLFDLDGTLIETAALMKHVLEQMDVQLRIPRHTLFELYTDFRRRTAGKTFLPQDLWQEIAPQLPPESARTAKQLQNLFQEIVDSAVGNYIFPDVSNVVNTVSQKATVAIYTEGENEWQELKISAMTKGGVNSIVDAAIGSQGNVPVQKFEDELQFVNQDKTSKEYLRHINVVLLGRGIKNVVIVDDNPEVLRRVRANWPKNYLPEPELVLLDRTAKQLDTAFTRIASLSELRDKVSQLFSGK